MNIIIINLTLFNNFKLPFIDIIHLSFDRFFILKLIALLNIVAILILTYEVSYTLTNNVFTCFAKAMLILCVR